MDFNSIADDLAAQFGLGQSKSSGGEYDDIAKQLADDHGITSKPAIKPELKRVYITPAPPVSGASEEESNQINEAFSKQPSNTGKGSYTGDLLPPTDVIGSIGRNFEAGKQLAGEGINDIETGKPYRGFIKTAGGILTAGLSPVSGAVEGGIEKPVTEITGNPDIGSRAGFVASSALPLVPGASAVTKAIPKNKAFQTLVDSIGVDNVGNVAREMRANPRLSPADLSPATKQTVQKLFVTEGDKTKNYLADTVEGRLQSAKSAVEDAFNKGMGPTVDPAAKMKQLSDNIKAVGAKEINPVLKATKPVDLTPVIEHIDNTLKPGVQSIISNPENMLPYTKVQKLLQSYRDQITNNKTVLTDPDVLNKLQSGMRRNAESLMRNPDAEAKAMGYSLYQLRNKIIDAIGKAGPQTIDKEGNAISAYRAGLSKYRDENNIADAFEHGHDAIIKNSRNLEDHPSYFKNWIKNATDGEIQAAKEGAKVAVDTRINGFKNAARLGTDIGQSEFNKERIRALFGKKEADEIFTKLEHERKIAETNSDLVRGAQTAMRQTADSRIALPTKHEVGKGAIAASIMETGNILAHGTPGVGTATLLGLKGASMAKHAIATTMAKEHNLSFAKMALPIAGPQREELIKALEAVANRQKPSMLSKVNSVARLFGP